MRSLALTVIGLLIVAIAVTAVFAASEFIPQSGGDGMVGKSAAAAR